MGEIAHIGDRYTISNHKWSELLSTKHAWPLFCSMSSILDLKQARPQACSTSSMLDLKHARPQACSTSSMLNLKHTLNLIALLNLTLCSKKQTLHCEALKYSWIIQACRLVWLIIPSADELKPARFWLVGSSQSSARSGSEIFDGTLARLARARKFLIELWLGSLGLGNFCGKFGSARSSRPSFWLVPPLVTNLAIF